MTSFLTECHGGQVIDGLYCCNKNETESCCNDRKNGFIVNVVTSVTAVSHTPTLFRYGTTTTSLGRFTKSSSGPETTLSSTDLTSQSTTRAETTLSSTDLPSQSITRTETTLSSIVLSLQSTTPASLASANPTLGLMTTANESSVPISAPRHVASSHSGRKIGAGIGAAVGVVLIIGLALLWFRRRGLKDHRQTAVYDNSRWCFRSLSETDGPKPLHISAPLQSMQPPSDESSSELPPPIQTSPVDPVEQTPVARPRRVLGFSRRPSIPSRDFGRSVPSLVSTNSIVHPSSPGLIKAAIAASRYLEQPSPAPTPDPAYQQTRVSIQPLARLPTHKEDSPESQQHENPFIFFPPKSPSSPHLPLSSTSKELRPSTSDGITWSTSSQFFDPTVSPAPKQPDTIFTPAHNQDFSHPSPSHPAARKLPRPTPPPFLLGNAPNTIKAQLVNHAHPLRSNRPSLILSDPVDHDLTPPLNHPPPATFPPINITPASPSGNETAADICANDRVANVRPGIPNFSRNLSARGRHPARNSSRHPRDNFSSPRVEEGALSNHF